MTSTTNLFHPSSNRAALAPCGVVVAGLMALYLPSFIDLFKGAWATEKNAHGPIVMAVAFAYLTFRLRQVSAQGLLERRPQPLPGGLMLVFGLLCYVLGRSQSVLVLEVGSMVPVLSGIMVAGFGVRTWSRMWFAFFFMFFMIPLPTSVVDVVTLPMKIAVSYAAEHLLYWTGYPVARSGVMLSIGPYQLLVADACAGLNSLFTLEAMGLLYMNLVRHQSAVRNAVLATLIVPISFAANTIRIMCLALITYHLGDGAGQGFLHGFSGLVLFLSALVLIACIDGLLTRLVGTPRSDPALRPASRAATAGRWQHMAVFGGRASAAMMIAMVSSLALAQVLTPTLQSNDAGAPLADSVPLQFGEWKALPNAPMQAELSTAGDGGKSQEQPYDDVLMRTYVNNAGEQVMLAIAYARAQRQDVKLHFPDVCYPAQGYKVLELTPASLSMTGNDTALPGKHMLASGNGRLEAVTYWARTGDAYPQGGLAMRMKIFRDGLQGKVTDGMLVRSSMLVHSSAGAANAYAVQERFLKQLVSASNMHGKALIARTTEVKS